MLQDCNISVNNTPHLRSVIFDTGLIFSAHIDKINTTMESINVAAVLQEPGNPDSLACTRSQV